MENELKKVVERSISQLNDVVIRDLSGLSAQGWTSASKAIGTISSVSIKLQEAIENEVKQMNEETLLNELADMFDLTGPKRNAKYVSSCVREALVQLEKSR